MRVLVCPDKFSGLLSASQAAAAVREGWLRQAPHDEVTLAPLSSGEAGFVDSVEAALGGTSIGVTVSDPLGRDVPATVLLVEGSDGLTAYLEAAQAVGLHLLDAAERNPATTSSYGVGQLIAAALEEGATRVVVATGGVATCDAGAGLAAALGVGPRELLGAGGIALNGLRPEDVQGFSRVRERLATIEVIAATEADLPLLGFGGSAATASPEMGASPEVSQALERGAAAYVDSVERAAPAPTDLLSCVPLRLERAAGAGAGGGLGFTLMALGAARVSAPRLMLNLWDIDGLLSRHDIVLTGESNFSGRSVRSGAVYEVAQAALAHTLPTVVLAGEVTVGRRESMAAGISAVYSVAERGDVLSEVMQNPIEALEARAARLAATWSR